MYLSSGQCAIPTEDRDYPEWHKHRSDYALWYLECLSPDLIDYLAEVRSQFQDLLLMPNQRQFHITLFICGFLNSQLKLEDDFSSAQLAHHIQALQDLQLSSFQLQTGAINSFSSALFIEIEDHQQHLTQIRQALYPHSKEIVPLAYCPHITLGLYKKEIPSDLILDRIQRVKMPSFTLEITQLSFGYYHAQQLQGPLFSHT